MRGTSAEYSSLTKMKVNMTTAKNGMTSAFFKDVGWKPSSQHQLSKHDINKPHGKENTYWSNPLEERKERLKLGLPQELAIDIEAILAQTGAATTV